MRNIQQQIDEAIDEAQNGSSFIALIELEELVKTSSTPRVMAWLGYCLAKEKQEYSRAMVLCASAVDTDPDDPDLYLAQGRVNLLAGRRYQALTALRKGLKMGRHELIVMELNRMGLRKEPVFGTLDRTNKLNVMVGRVMTRFNFR